MCFYLIQIVLSTDKVKLGSVLNAEKKLNTTSSSDGTNVFQGQSNSSNALGHVGPNNFSISQAPYVVKSCDQVLLIPVQRIVDFNDYCKKQDGFFTMSVYMVNLFEAKDSNKLLESITLDKITTVPRTLAGAPGCIDFLSGNKRIAVCLKGDELVQQVIQAYQSFLRCRMGDNLKVMSMQEMMKVVMMSACGAKNLTNPGVTALPGANSTILPSIGKSAQPSLANINPYYADLKVPGS